MEVTIAVVVNILLAGAIAKRLGKRLGLKEIQKSIFLSLVTVIVAAAIGFVTPIAFFALAEELGIIVWRDPGQLVLKMIGFGFWSSLIGAYLGLREVRAIAKTAEHRDAEGKPKGSSEHLLKMKPVDLSEQLERAKAKVNSLPKESKQWLFWGVFWAASVLLYTIGFDPFNNGSWDFMDSDEYSTLFFVMFVPPLFLFVAKKVYDKFVK